MHDNVFTQSRLDRAHTLRHQDDTLEATLAHPATRLVPVWRTKNLVNGPRAGPKPVLVPAATAWWRQPAGAVALLGLVDGVAYVAADLSDIDEPKAHPDLAGLGAFVDLRTMGQFLTPADAGLLAYARALMWWHQRHRFCGVCGSPTDSREAGHSRICRSRQCGTAHFPRTDPAVIVLVHHGDHCLLARQPGWPAGMHSVLAGFVEPGESLESCVHREVGEETGIALADLRYHSSQPWPFPQSLMVGFTARALTTDFRLDDREIEHADWYARDWLNSLPPGAYDGTGPFHLPRRISIARRLLDEWRSAG